MELLPDLLSFIVKRRKKLPVLICRQFHIYYLIFQGGVERCIRVLESCLDEQDWSLACLVCQALWNYCIDSNNITESIVDEESLCNLEGILSF